MIDLEIINKNIFENDAESIVHTVDGLVKDGFGNIARGFEKKYSEEWEN